MRREYIVWRPDYGQAQEDGRHIDAIDAGCACEKWAQREDSESADYLIVSGNPAKLLVVLAEEGAPIEAFTVYGESVPEYRAHPAPDGREASRQDQPRGLGYQGMNGCSADITVPDFKGPK